MAPLSSTDIIEAFFGSARGQGQAGPAQVGFAGKAKQAITAAGDVHFVSDFWDMSSVSDVDAPGGCLVDGGLASVQDLPPDPTRPSTRAKL